MSWLFSKEHGFLKIHFDSINVIKVCEDVRRQIINNLIFNNCKKSSIFLYKIAIEKLNSSLYIFFKIYNAKVLYINFNNWNYFKFLFITYTQGTPNPRQKRLNLPETKR